MISSLRGPVLSALGSTVVIELGGVGLSVQATPTQVLALRVGEEAMLHTTLIVREDSLTLYGFASTPELSVFEHLIGVTGVGPKSALGVLSVLSPEEIALAVAGEDDAAFRKVSGIGPKTAKLMVVSLTGKLLAPAAPTASTAKSRVVSTPAQSVVVALIGLGWAEKVASQVVDEIVAEGPATEVATVAQLLRLALGRLGPAKRVTGSTGR